MSVFSFKLQSKKLIYLLCLSVVFLVNEIITSKMKPARKKGRTQEEKNKEDFHPLLLTLIMCIGETFCGFIELYKRMKNKSKINYETALLSSETVKSNSEETDIRIQKLKVQTNDVILIVIMGIIDFLVFAFILVAGGRKSFDVAMVVKIGQIIFLGLFSKWILSIPLYKHHIVSLIVIGFTILVVSVIALLNETNQNEEKTFNSIPLIIQYFCILLSLFIINSLNLIAQKHLIDKRFYSPYLLICLSGFIGIILTFLSQGIVLTSKFHCTERNSFYCRMTQPNSKTIDNMYQGLLEVFEPNKKIYFLYFCVLLICSMAINSFTGIIIQTFNPTYLGIGDSLGAMLVWFYFRILYSFYSQERKARIFITTFLGIILFIIAIICCLIYTELLIFDCFGLKYNTKDEIIKRSEKEIRNADNLLNISTASEKSCSSEEENIN